MSVVERYLQEQDRIIAEDKRQTLISLGVVEREYAPEGKQGWPYDKYEIKDGVKRYYREVAATVTDEEYALILEKSQQIEKIKSKKGIGLKPKAEPVDQEDITSKVAAILRCIAGISAAIAALAGLILLTDQDTLIWGIAMLITAFVESVFVWALAEILDKLTEIAYYCRRIWRK